MNRVRLRLLFVVLGLALSVIAVGHVVAATYYAAPNGSNSNDGTIDHPWFSVKYALTRLLDNDTLYLR